MIFSSLAAQEVVILTTSATSSDKNEKSTQWQDFRLYKYKASNTTIK